MLSVVRDQGESLVLVGPVPGPGAIE